MEKSFITGAAGFIGSNLADHLLSLGHEVVGYDNLSTGQREFLVSAEKNSRFRLVKGDLLDTAALTKAMEGCTTVYHLAANADVRFGTEHPRKDLEQNTIATFNVLEAMRACGAKRIAFSSTGSIYGEPEVFPTPEDAPFPKQTSLYGASKLAGEGLIQAYAEGFEFEGYIFRFVSILGERYTHGHVFDFLKQLREHPSYLNVLGDGSQTKSYLYVQDCVRAITSVMGQHIASRDPHRIAIFNLGTDQYCQVKDSIRWICETLGLKPEIKYGGGTRGWIGDSPFIFLDTKKVQGIGWKPELTIQQGIERTVTWLSENGWVFDQRS